MIQRRNKVLRIALILLGIGALYTLLTYFTNFGIPCLFYTITGLQCPGCGISRMFLALFQLDFAAAFHYNVAVLCLLPLFILVGVRKIYLYIRYNRKKDLLSDIGVWGMIVVLILFGVLRNIL